MTIPFYEIDLTDSPADEDTRVVREGLTKFNTDKGVPNDWVPLAVFVRDSAGQILGGLTGGTYWNWLYVGMFWLSEGIRGQGLGSQLLARAEREGLQRGCRHSFLDTTSFQALPFYLKQGYKLYAQLDDFPPGHSRYFLKKSLVPIQDTIP
jgi:GNAT superfamily N-acetyltransferase